MIVKLWQEKLVLDYEEDVFDIVQFGSSLESEDYNDIDIAVIYKSFSLKKQLEHSQKIKKQLQEIFNNIDVKSFSLEKFFSPSNFARENILFKGKSLVSGKYFCENFGLKPKLLIKYKLEELKKSHKVKVNYWLTGKAGKYGLLRESGGELVKPGIVEVDPLSEVLIVSKLKELNAKVELERVFKQKLVS